EPPHVGCYKGRIFEEIVTGYVLRELICEKAFVGSVFEKSADEISHAGKEFADGAIFAQATAHFQNGGLDGISHAVEHLKFEIAAGNTKTFRLRENMRNAADIMGAEGGVNNAVIFQQQH